MTAVPTDKKRPMLVKNAPHVKRQTGRTCTGILVHDMYYDEYTCLACGWSIDGRVLESVLLASEFLGGEVCL